MIDCERQVTALSFDTLAVECHKRWPNLGVVAVTEHYTGLDDDGKPVDRVEKRDPFTLEVDTEAGEILVTVSFRVRKKEPTRAPTPPKPQPVTTERGMPVPAPAGREAPHANR